MVEIFHRGQHVGVHQRRYIGQQARHGPRPYAQLPPALRRVDAVPVPPVGRQDRAEHEGLISAVLASRPHPEQGFRTCLGILRSYPGLDPARLEAVSARAVELASSIARASPPSSPANTTLLPPRTAVRPPSPTPSSTASFTMPIASIWPARACASGGPRHEIDARSKTGSPDPRRDKAVDNGGLRYGAMESALRPPLPTATRAATPKPGPSSDFAVA